MPAKPGTAQFFETPVSEGRVYPRLYATRDQFDAVDLPDRWARFVVIRDLRDTVVSAYFSLRFSHDTAHLPNVRGEREKLRALSFRDGLERTMDLARKSAAIQRSWLEAGEELIRYEDLLEDDTAILSRVLIDQCGLEVDRDKLQAAIRASRFAAMSGGRPRGREDHTAHHRKGEPGDWHGYLRGSLKDSFKEKWGELLIATGYERDLDW